MITGATNTKKNFPNTGPSFAHQVTREGSTDARFAIHAGMVEVYLGRRFNMKSIPCIIYDEFPFHVSIGLEIFRFLMSVPQRAHSHHCARIGSNWSAKCIRASLAAIELMMRVRRFRQLFT